MRFLITTVALIATGAVVRKQDAPTPGISVGARVQVSAPRAADTHYEVVAAADPTDANHLLAASLVYPDTGSSWATVVYESHDRGDTWQASLGGTALDRTGDPALAFGPDGTAHYVVSIIPMTGDRKLLAFRLAPRSPTWTDAVPFTYMDRQYVVVDDSRGSRRGTIYVNGNNRVPRSISDFVIHRSSDGGRTWTGPGTRSAFGSVQASIMGNAVVGGGGTLVGVYVRTDGASGGSALRAARSTDGGITVGEDVLVDRYVAGGDRKGAIAGNANSEPMLARDASAGPFAGRLYVAWPDRRDGRTDIRLAISDDDGRTWSPSRVVSDAPAGLPTDQFMPSLAVNRDGVVGLSWYDRRNRPDNIGWETRFTASSDGGRSWAPSVAVSTEGSRFPAGTTRTRSPAPSEPSPRDQVNAGRDSFRFMGGDTAGLAADAAGTFHPVWVDNHTGVPQLWTARVQVNGTVRRAGR